MNVCLPFSTQGADQCRHGEWQLRIGCGGDFCALDNYYMVLSTCRTIVATRLVIPVMCSWWLLATGKTTQWHGVYHQNGLNDLWQQTIWWWHGWLHVLSIPGEWAKLWFPLPHSHYSQDARNLHPEGGNLAKQSNWSSCAPIYCNVHYWGRTTHLRTQMEERTYPSMTSYALLWSIWHMCSRGFNLVDSECHLLVPSFCQYLIIAKGHNMVWCRVNELKTTYSKWRGLMILYSASEDGNPYKVKYLSLPE
jgi:hypothetical protein